MKLSGATPDAGRIVRKRIDSDDGTFCYVTYAFEDREGRSHQREVQLRKANFDRLQEGRRTSVVHEPGNPANSCLAELGFRSSHLLATCLWLLLAAVLSYVAYEFIDQCVMQGVCPAEN